MPAMSFSMPLSCFLMKFRLRRLPGVRRRIEPNILLMSVRKASDAALTRALVFSGRGNVGASGPHSAAVTNCPVPMARGARSSATA